MIGNKTELANIDSVFKTEKIRNFPSFTFTETHLYSSEVWQHELNQRHHF